MDRGKSILDVDDADAFVGVAVLLAAILVMAAVIVLSIWPLRTARNARATGATDVSPGLACGGWYIPYAQRHRPVRPAAPGRDPPSPADVDVSLWQGLFITSYLVSMVFRTMGNIDLADDADELTDRLTAQAVLAFVLAGLFLVMAFVAMRAMRDVDGVTAERP